MCKLLLILLIGFPSFAVGSISPPSVDTHWQEPVVDSIRDTSGRTREETSLREETASKHPDPVPLQFEDQKIRDFQSDPEFDYSENPEDDNWWNRFKRYVNLKYHQLMEWLFGDYEASSVLRFIVQLLPYLVILLILSLAVWIFSKLNPGAALLKTENEARVFFSEEEEIVKSRDIETLITNALADENYRLAIRYQFLLVLQKLTQKELIDYNFSKTNEDYGREIKDQGLKKQFSKVSHIYDFTWYGNFEASKEYYQTSHKEFITLHEQIQKNRE